MHPSLLQKIVLKQEYNTANDASLQYFYAIPAKFVDIILFTAVRKVLFIQVVTDRKSKEGNQDKKGKSERPD